MPNPLSRVRPSAVKSLEMGPEPVIQEEVELAKWMLRVLAVWPYVENQLGFSLSNLLHTEGHTGAAIFVSLRSTLAQEEVLKTAAEVALDGDPDLPLFRALLLITRGVANQRNTIAHGMWGRSRKLPNALLCEDPQMLARLRGQEVRRVKSGMSPEDIGDVDPRDVWVYRARDFELLYNSMEWLINSFADFWQMRDSQPTQRAQLRARLEREPRIQEVLRQLQKAGESARKSQPPSGPPAPTQE